jgi:hypothetical protein
VGVPALSLRPVPPEAGVVSLGIKIRYRGSPSSIGLLDSLLRDEGLQVERRQIVEQPGVQQDIVDIVLYVADPDVNGALDTAPGPLIKPKIEIAIAALRASVPRAQVEIVATRDAQPPVPA